jgi:hypothetical protein
VITGHNTDVDYAGRTYHVQTEDKGLSNPIIESLVYSRGEILEIKRTSYAEGIKDGYDEKIVLRFMEQQHSRMLRAVRHGHYDPKGPQPFGYNLISSRTLDEVVLEWLEADGGGAGITIGLEDEPTFFDGTDATVSVSVRGGGGAEPLSGATLKVRFLDPRAKSAGVYEGSADERGRVDAAFKIPELAGGQGALVFEVRHAGRAAELTRPVLSSRWD